MKQLKPRTIASDPDTGQAAICALRYCIGRRSYLPSLIIVWVKRYWELFDFPTRLTIFKDLKQEIDGKRDLGDECDRDTWMKFYQWMQDKEPDFKERAKH